MNSLSPIKIRHCWSGANISCLVLFLVLILPVKVLAVKVIWTRTYNGTANSDDYGKDVALGPDGSVYVTGFTYVSGQSNDIWVRKYSPRGRVRWTRTYNGDDNLGDRGEGVAVGFDGSVYVTGYTYVSGQDYNIWVRKYSPRGRVRWTRTYNGDDNSTDYGRDVAVGPDGSVYVTGHTNVTGQEYNIWVRKYSPRGKVRWTRKYNGEGNSYDCGYGIAAGPDGSVYVTGYTNVTGQENNIWVRKYSPRGRVKWTRTYNGDDNAGESGNGVAVGPDGSVYVTGYTEDSGQENNIWVRKYSSRGRVKWTRKYNGDDNSDDSGFGVAVGPDGSVYVTGDTYVTGQSYNVWVRKYSPRGRVKWTRTYNGTANSYDVGSGIAVGPDGSVYVVGDTEVTGQSGNIWVRKYR